MYKRFRERGYEVFAVNPNTETVEGDTAFPDLKSIPGGVGAVVIGTRPETADATMAECVELGISQVWMHRAMGAGSVSASATEYGRKNAITGDRRRLPPDVRSHCGLRAQVHEVLSQRVRGSSQARRLRFGATGGSRCRHGAQLWSEVRLQHHP